MKPRIWLLLVLVTLTAARFWCLGRIELTPDEAYHALWAQHPDWCYYDKGPVIAMTIRAGTELFGRTEFGVRFFSPLLALGTSLVLFVLARKLYGEVIAIWTVVVLNVLPVFQSGSLGMAPGTISVFFWAAAMLTFWLALERGPRLSFYWPATGLLVGAGLLTEYVNAMVLVSIVLVLASTGKFRREFARPGFWLMLVVFIPFMIPAFRWNARHEWITLLSWRGEFGADGFHPYGTLRWITDCALGFSPLIFAGMLIAAWRGLKKARHQFKPRFLLLFSLPLIGLEILLSPW
ncbi:MAG: glycosyltransferase family 39 protein, partial [Verrucomicrobiota bacterium]